MHVTVQALTRKSDSFSSFLILSSHSYVLVVCFYISLANCTVFILNNKIMNVMFLIKVKNKVHKKGRPPNIQ